MVRVDFIRVPGNEWVSNPDHRFTTVDMRGPLIELVQRTFSVIADDLPKGFLLPEGQIQAESVGLPTKVLREAIVNAFIHRTYRENQPIQIIRYGNRIEIKNPGFSLKPEDQLGEPGSKNRNPFISSIFHETNLAETKGSGIRTMRALMKQAGMVLPTFESDHSSNTFTARLLLHHFLSENDVNWLRNFDPFGFNVAQKTSLIFIREAGAIDNSTYRQINNCDVMRASSELRSMRDLEILDQKGKGKATYYVPGKFFNILSDEADVVVDELGKLTEEPISLTDEPINLTDEPTRFINEVKKSTEQKRLIDNALELNEKASPIPEEILSLLSSLGKRSNDKEALKEAIIELCRWRPMKLIELAQILNRSTNHLFNSYVLPLKEEGRLKHLYVDMPNHPEQAYVTVERQDK